MRQNESVTGSGRDEVYVMDLCDEALQEKGSRQHRFEWRLGDPGQAGRRAKLPVDGYWAGAGLVVEYRELQHDRPVNRSGFDQDSFPWKDRVRHAEEISPRGPGPGGAPGAGDL